MFEVFSEPGFDVIMANKQILFCTAVIWLVVLGCALSSVWTQPFSKKQRTFWTVVVLGMPLLGLLSYLPFAIRKENYPGLFNTKNK